MSDLKTKEEGVTVTSRDVHTVDIGQADDAAAFVAGMNPQDISEEDIKRVRRKIDLHVMPILMLMYFIQFLDKNTLGSSSILGIKTDNHLSSSEYNWLGTIFYLSYLIFEWPQNLALQRFPPAKWMAGNILVWGVVLMCQAACHNFSGLFVCRFFLGACEGSITAGFLIVTSMFYTHDETARRVGYWFLMNGSAIIFGGFLSWATFQMDAKVFAPWRLFMIVCGGLTLITGALFWFFIPDSPMTAYFLTKEERVIAIQRLAHQSSGIENKHWKKDQFLEALTDWKCWAFFFLGSFTQLPNSLSNQNALIINSFGFTTSQTALLGMVLGAIEIFAILTATGLLKRYPNSRSYVAAVYYIPSIISAIMIITLPWSNKGGLLTAMYLGQLGIGPSFVIALAWCTTTSAGHTKKTTGNAMLLIGYCLGNLLAPQMWKAQYSPRYYIPWGVILAAYIICPLMFITIGLFLRKENRRRDRLQNGGQPAEKYFDANGDELDPTFLDLTDRQNLGYRYPL